MSASEISGTQEKEPIKTIALKAETYSKLLNLKAQLIARKVSVRTFNDVVEYLLQALEECERLKSGVSESKVKSILCGELREAQASLPAWDRLLRNKGLSEMEINYAKKYLVRSPEEPMIYMVSPEACGE
jgi:predicted CopG family antitoxin